MSNIVQEIKQFVNKFDHSLLNTKNQGTSFIKIIEDQNFQDFFKIITKTDTYSEGIANEFQKEDAITGLSSLKILKSALNHKSYFFLQNLSDLIFSFDKDKGDLWRDFAESIKKQNIADVKILDLALK